MQGLRAGALQEVARVARAPLSTSAALASALAPTFATSGSPARLVTKLGAARAARVVARGSLDSLPPPSYCLTPSTFLPSAVEAVGLVTASVVEEQWGGLEGLVEPQCLAAMREVVEGMGEHQRRLITLNPGDVFLSFISNEASCDEGKDVTMVTFSFPGLEQIRSSQQVVKERMEELRELRSEGRLHGARFELVTREMVQLQKTTNPATIFQDNQIVLGNYRLVRASHSSQWAVREMGQVNILAALPSPLQAFARFRWRGRINIHVITGTNFLTILRMDYITDIVFLLLAVISWRAGGF